MTQHSSGTNRGCFSTKTCTFATVIVSGLVSIFLVFFTDIIDTRIRHKGRATAMISLERNPNINKLASDSELVFMNSRLRPVTHRRPDSATTTIPSGGVRKEDNVDNVNEGRGSFNNKISTAVKPRTSKEMFNHAANTHIINATKGERVTGTLPVRTTVMSFDSKHVVICKETPFVSCHWQSQMDQSPKNTSSGTKVFRISILRRPSWLGHNAFQFNKCEYKGCRYDNAKVTEQTDVVNLYSVRLRDDFPIPERWPHQIYLASTWEPQRGAALFFLKNPNSHWRSNYNLTMSYRTTDDIFVPYGRLKFNPIPVDQRPNYYEIAKKKDKMVAWLVSHCRAVSGRDEYAREMQKYIPVDIYGGCGTPANKSITEVIKTRYKFYLAFENTICPDYVTEKFFKFFLHDTHIIQVVRGGADYDKYFPEGTFINAANFESPKDLAIYLNNLAKNLTAYSHLLEKKDLYTLTGEGISSLGCKLCKYLHTHKLEPPKVSNMELWQDCPNPGEFPKLP